MTNEAQLLSRARQLDPAALAEIYDLYNADIFRYASRQLGDAEMAEDCVAETFSRLLHTLHRGGGPKDHLRAYLYRIAHNWITDTFRSRVPPDLELNTDILSDPHDQPEQAVERLLTNDHVRAALMKLTPDQRQVIVLRYIEGWPHKEIAQSIKKPAGAVKALQQRGIAALRRILVEDETNDSV